MKSLIDRVASGGHRLLSDDRGTLLSSELVLLATIMLLGLLVGMAAVRDAVVQEVGDTAASIGSLQQSFSLDAVAVDGSFAWALGSIPYDASTTASSFSDQRDLGENPDPDPPAAAPMCITIDATTIKEE